MENYLLEAFQKLSLLNEDDFDLTADRDKIDELQSFVADDVDEIPEEPVIDLDAENEDELADNYVGKVIIECECCHARLYKEESEVFVDEESGLANIEEACPVCNNTLGYSVIGKIEKFDEEDVVDDEEEIELENDPMEEEPVESLRDRLNRRRALGEAKKVCPVCGKEPCVCENKCNEELSDLASDDSEKLVDPEADPVLDESLEEDASTDSYAQKVYDAVKIIYNKWNDDEDGGLNLSEIKRLPGGVKEIVIDGSGNYGAQYDTHFFVYPNTEKIGYISGDYYDDDEGEIPTIFYEDNIHDLLRIFDIPSSEIPHDDVTDIDYNESLKEDIENISVDTDDTHLDMVTNEEGGVDIHTSPIDKGAEEIVPLSDEEEADILDNTEDEETLDDIDFEVEPGEEELGGEEEFGLEGEEEEELPAESLKTNGKAVNEDYADIEELSKKVLELKNGLKSIGCRVVRNNTSSSNPTFSVYISPGKPMGYPGGNANPELSARIKEVNDFIRKNYPEFAVKGKYKPDVLGVGLKDSETFAHGKSYWGDEYDEYGDGIFVDENMDINEFDDHNFNDLCESFLRKVYENVNTYKTTAVKDNGERVVVEGVITFKNNKQMKSNFVFTEAKETKTGKVVLEGYNETFSKQPKCFKVKGSLKNNNYVAESMSYHYTTKTLNEGKEEDTKVGGRVRINR